MNSIRVTALVAALVAGSSALARSIPAAQQITINLTQWTGPDIARVANDPFGSLIRYGYALFADTAAEIGPAAPDPKMRFAGYNLACKNCHLQGGRQPYAMPLIGIWGQFPQYRAREGALEPVENRINGCMERSMNGRACPSTAAK